MATKKQLLARAAELGIDDVNEKTKNADIEARIEEVEGVVGVDEDGRCKRCGRPGFHYHVGDPIT